jgi:hypothetical protein
MFGIYYLTTSNFLSHLSSVASSSSSVVVVVASKLVVVVVVAWCFYFVYDGRY